LTEHKASQTAQGISVLRAAHQVIDGSPKILEDPIIVHMLDQATRLRLRDRPEIYQTKRLRGLRVQALVRSRFAEDRLAEAVRRGLRQFVILGAGMDTFAYRQPAWAKGLQIFELDQPASQVHKRRALETAGVAEPANLTFLEIDFEKDSLRTVLGRSQFNFAQAAFFSCLGVLMYLTPAAVTSILGFVASTPPPGEMVFSFANRARRDGSTGKTSATQSIAARLGEPWLSTAQPEILEGELHALGFSEVSFLTPAMIHERYLRDRPDGLPVPSQTRIVSAKI
jgi:methyltransferase (TIGR00027 family)